MEKIDLLKDGLKKIGIAYNDKMLEQFSRYYELLVEWNDKFNLTAITDPEGVVVKHFLDSLLLLKLKDLTDVNTLLDLGTGAGFPGIPIKIVYPQLKLSLVDSVNKKVQFLNVVASELGLDNVQCIHSRAEDLAKDLEHREKYDIVVSRAVSNLATLSEYCIPFVKVGGIFTSYKSADYEMELEDAKNAINLLGGTIEAIEVIPLPASDINRAYIFIRKINHTANKFPRKAGMPLKNPL